MGVNDGWEVVLNVLRVDWQDRIVLSGVAGAG